VQQWVGWLVVIGFGFVFSIITYLIVVVTYTYGESPLTSEEFNTAGRSVKTGLTASVIVSQWTWAATLLQSSNVAWKYGVSGPFWCVPVTSSSRKSRALHALDGKPT
jgi:urea-proton symporter